MRKGERKRQLLAAAKDLFAARGFAGVVLDDLAAAADITPGRLARYFPDRAALVRAVINDLRADTFPPPDPADAALDPVGQLQAFLDRATAAARKPTPGFRVLLRALVELTDADRRAELQAVLLECTEPVVRVLQAGQQAGVIRRSLDASEAAWELVQAVIGFALTGPRDAAARTNGAPGPFDGLLHGVLKVDV
jgi:TetR/AcrR family transcriptional regulator